MLGVSSVLLFIIKSEAEQRSQNDTENLKTYSLSFAEARLEFQRGIIDSKLSKINLQVLSARAINNMTT